MRTLQLIRAERIPLLIGLAVASLAWTGSFSVCIDTGRATRKLAVRAIARLATPSGESENRRVPNPGVVSVRGAESATLLQEGSVPRAPLGTRIRRDDVPVQVCVLDPRPEPRESGPLPRLYAAITSVI